MDNLFRRRMQPIDNIGMAAATVAVVIALFRGAWVSILVGVAFFLMIIGALPQYLALALLGAASAIMLLQNYSQTEGFEDAKKEEDVKKPAADEPAPANEPPKAANKETHEEAFDGVARTKPMLPDNADRREPLELGKPYKLPSEKDDKGFHLDSGTTFLNAYKALKPDQIAAMTRDTQELLATQKSLVGMLESFGPLLTDMNKITGFFGNK